MPEKEYTLGYYQGGEPVHYAHNSKEEERLKRTDSRKAISRFRSRTIPNARQPAGPDPDCHERQGGKQTRRPGLLPDRCAAEDIPKGRDRAPGDQGRLDRLKDEIERLKAQLASGLAERQAEAVDADPAVAEQAILAYLRTQTEPVDEDMIHEAVEGRRITKLRALRKLVDDGKVKRTGTGKRGDAYR